MNKNLKEKINESLSSVLPITVIVLILSMTLAPMPVGTLLLFIIGAVLLIVGMGFFSLGADISMMPIGDHIGGRLSKFHKLLPVLLVCFIIGVFVTIAEPDLQVLSHQVPVVPDWVLIFTVAIGVGVFLVAAVLKIRFGWSLNSMLLIFYIALFVFAFFVPDNFLAVAFDSGGVTTGPITVPFILALGLGLSSAGKSSSGTNSFGLVALCSIGPIIAVMLLGICYNSSSIIYQPDMVPNVVTTQEMGIYFAQKFPVFVKEVAMGLLPIMIFFILFQVLSLRIGKRPFIKIIVGAFYTYIGLVMFLTGVNVGFKPAAEYIGSEIARLPYNWILIPLGMLIGYFIVAAEPAVHVLNKQVEENTGGAVPHKAMQISLSIGVAVSLGIAMLRVIAGISIMWFIIPGYILAGVLTFFVPKMFTAIAFDSGGVASGPMTATFLLPFAVGACQTLGGDILTDAFGIVAMVAMTPLITIQLLGLIYKHKMVMVSEISEKDVEFVVTDEIIDYTEDKSDE